MKLTPAQISSQLRNFTGTDNYYKYARLHITEGTRFLAESCESFWLLDLIASFQWIPNVRIEPFQVYRLRKMGEDSAIVTVEEGNKNILHFQVIEYTSFPLEEITLWLCDGIILLPSEY